MLPISSRSKVILKQVLVSRSIIGNCMGIFDIKFDIFQGIGTPVTSIKLIIVFFFEMEVKSWIRINS